MEIMQKTRLCSFFCVTPLHAGSGQALAAVDLPIQRERHTKWPHVQASGVKGAFRDWFRRYFEEKDPSQAATLTDRIFGKAEDDGGQAGAVAFTDVRILAFPVRSNVAPFVWVTCPAVLERLKRDLALCSSRKHNTWEIPTMGQDDEYIPIIGDMDGDIVLEDLVVKKSNHADATNIRDTLQGIAPQVTRLILVSDNSFSMLVTTATEVQPQIRIDIATGTADDGSLRYQELLPSESVLYGLVFFTKERTEKDTLLVDVIEQHVTEAVSTHIQMGGDMTLGRGIMEVTWWLPK